MASRLLVTVDLGNHQDRDRVTLALNQQRDTFWWHMFPHVWLIVDPSDRDTAFWRDWIRTIAPRLHVLVVDADGGGWSSFMTTKQSAWLHKHWKRDPY